ncbi:MAG TPA: oligoendopeptidase F [Vicinamibacterales bacterium]|nr:oligoendopeptidase F [Vicinamibacterales bacterium]
MIRNRARLSTALFVACFGLAALSTVAGQERDRTKIDDKFKWNLTDLFASDEAWRAAKDELAPEIAKATAFRGTLGSSPARLADALETLNRLNKELQRVYVYASLKSDQDTRESKYQGMQQEMQQFAAKFGEQVSFVEPEILKIDKATLDKWLAQEARLKTYKHYLDDIQRRQPHTLTDNEERLLAASSVAAGTGSSVYNILANADFPYPSVTLSDGKTVKLDSSSFSLYRGVANRDDRQKVMSTFFNSLGAFKGTFGSTLNGQVQANEFFAGARRYKTAIEAALDPNNLPVTVYTRLVDGVNQGLPTFQRYLQLRKKMMKLPDLHYYDLYAPLVAATDLTYTPEESQKNVLAALAPLGPEYVAAVNRAFKERWIDLLPNEGKRSGAYSQGGAYDVHPYMLINFNGKYADMTTVAHELGHTMQSYLSNKAQPFHLANYPIFVAEVASTFNEALLIDHMLKTIKDDDARLSLLGNYLENIKGTVFRQTQFAEFELRIHQMAEKGEPITGEALDKLYLEITRKYYGHDKGVCIVDDYVAHEWAFVPHFYYNFYVFQYATSFTASAALSEKVLAGDPAATKRYLAFLAAGGSKYPIDLLKDAGVDMTTDEPLQLTLQKMNRVMDDMEKLLAKKPGV